MKADFLEKIVNYAKRRCESKNMPDVSFEHNNHMVITKDIDGNICLHYIGARKLAINDRKKQRQYLISFNEHGQVIGSEIYKPEGKSRVMIAKKTYQTHPATQTMYLNIFIDYQNHIRKLWNYDAEKKRFIRRINTFDSSYLEYPRTNGEIIQFALSGKVSARYVVLNGSRHNYRDVITSEKDKLVISLRNEHMHWIRCALK